MRVIVVGASGIIGHEILSGLVHNISIDHVVSLSDVGSPVDIDSAAPGVEYCRVNLSEDLSAHFRFSDAVAYARWPIGDSERSTVGSRQRERLANVCASVARAEVRAFVYGSSAGGYSEAPAGASVDERWPTDGVPWLPLSLQIAQNESLVNDFAANHEVIRVVVLRPTLIVCPSKTPTRWAERLGKRVVGSVVAGRRVRVVPDLGSHGIQVIRVSDLAEAFCRAVTASVVGSFNVATEPITSDMLAAVFKAKKARVGVSAALKLHSYAWRLGLAALDPAALRLSRQTPMLSTARARSELGWSAKHSGTQVLEEWAHSFASMGTHEPKPTTSVEMNEFEVGPEVDWGALYERALSFFGQQVHAIRDDQWTNVTEFRGWTIWQLVASVARAQYRASLRLHGELEEEIERQLPGDPLGFRKADGWDLAAERGMSALREGHVLASTIEQVLPDVICGVTLRGECLARTIGLEQSTDPELFRFVEERMAPLGGQ